MSNRSRDATHNFIVDTPANKDIKK